MIIDDASKEAVLSLFARSKIFFCVGTIGRRTDFYSLKVRDFYGPMSGRFHIKNDNSELYKFYDLGKDIETYRSVEA